MCSRKSLSRNRTGYFPIVADHGLTAPQPSHHAGEILQLRGRHRGNAEAGIERADAAADAEGEAASRQAMHGGRPRAGDEPGWVREVPGDDPVFR
jgi:hypothetical protein